MEGAMAWAGTCASDWIEFDDCMSDGGSESSSRRARVTCAAASNSLDIHGTLNFGSIVLEFVANIKRITVPRTRMNLFVNDQI
jgi:hypothetical protein